MTPKFKKVIQNQLEKLSSRYHMCDDQLAQIDCRIESCFFHKNGKCINVSPAITLNTDGKFYCWSWTDDEN